MNTLASTLQAQGDLAGARALQEQVLTVRRRVLGEEHPSTLISMNNLAGTLWHCSERIEAIELISRAVEACVTKLGGDHPNTRACMNTLARMRADFDACTAPCATTP